MNASPASANSSCSSVLTLPSSGLVVVLFLDMSSSLFLSWALFCYFFKEPKVRLCWMLYHWCSRFFLDLNQMTDVWGVSLHRTVDCYSWSDMRAIHSDCLCNNLVCLQPTAIPLTAYGPMAAAAAAAVVRGMRVCVCVICRDKDCVYLCIYLYACLR